MCRAVLLLIVMHYNLVITDLKRLDDDDDDDDLFADLLSDSEEEDEKGKHYQTKPKLKLIDSISKAQPASNDNNDNGELIS